MTGGSATFKGTNLLDLEPEERSHAGLFLSFQSPVEVPGVNNVDFLRMAANARRAALGLPEMEPLEVKISEFGEVKGIKKGLRRGIRGEQGESREE